MDVRGPAFESGAGGNRLAAKADRIGGDKGNQIRRGIVPGGGAQQLAVEAENESPLGLAEPYGTFGQRIEDRLDIDGGTADYLQQFARRRLLVERHAEIAVLCLHFLEQPHILNGDHRLVGEGGQQFDALGAERPCFNSAHAENPDGLALPQQRDGQIGPEAKPRRHCAAFRKLIGGFAGIVQMDRFAVQDSSTAHIASSDGPFTEVERNGSVVRLHRERIHRP